MEAQSMKERTKKNREWGRANGGAVGLLRA